MYAKIVWFPLILFSCEFGGIAGQLPSVPSNVGGLPLGGLPVGGLPLPIATAAGAIPSIAGGIPAVAPSLLGTPSGVSNNDALQSLRSILANSGQSAAMSLGPLRNWPSLPNASPNNLLNIERPCHVSFSDCIKQYFSHHSKCKKVSGHVPEPLVRPVTPVYFARINLTMSCLDSIYTGLNGHVEEFYINKATDKLVITIRFLNYTMFSKETLWKFHRPAKEPVVNMDYVYVKFASLSTTTIIPIINDLQLEKSETFTYVDTAVPDYSIGPKAFVSSDPGVPATYAALLADLPTNAKEFFFTEGAFLAATYIQHSICDFGLKVL